MKMKLLYASMLFVFSSFSQAKSTVVNLSPSDAEIAFGILTQAGASTQYPAAEYSHIKRILCNLDKLQMVSGPELDEDGATSCSFRVESGQRISITGVAAVQLKQILERNHCKTQESGTFASVEASEMIVNFDRLQQNITGYLKK